MIECSGISFQNISMLNENCEKCDGDDDPEEETPKEDEKQEDAK